MCGKEHTHRNRDGWNDCTGGQNLTGRCRRAAGSQRFRGGVGVGAPKSGSADFRRRLQLYTYTHWQHTHSTQLRNLFIYILHYILKEREINIYLDMIGWGREENPNEKWRKFSWYTNTSHNRILKRKKCQRCVKWDSMRRKKKTSLPILFTFHFKTVLFHIHTLPFWFPSLVITFF